MILIHSWGSWSSERTEEPAQGHTAGKWLSWPGVWGQGGHPEGHKKPNIIIVKTGSTYIYVLHSNVWKYWPMPPQPVLFFTSFPLSYSNSQTIPCFRAGGWQQKEEGKGASPPRRIDKTPGVGLDWSMGEDGHEKEQSCSYCTPRQQEDMERDCRLHSDLQAPTRRTDDIKYRGLCKSLQVQNPSCHTIPTPKWKLRTDKGLSVSTFFKWGLNI